MEKAALRGEPSYVWRAGQERRLNMVLEAAGERIGESVLENGCGVGMYVQHLTPYASRVVGLEYEFERACQAHSNSTRIVNAAGEHLPFPQETFAFILSHEVLEHVQDDRLAVQEMVRDIAPGWAHGDFCAQPGIPF